MLNELLLRLNRPQDLPFRRQSTFGEGGLPGLLASLGNNQPPQPATEEGMKDMAASAEASKVLQGTTGGGISGWLRRSSQGGGLLNRIGDFGLAVQDATDGGNRSERLRAERLAMAQQEEQREARIRLGQMASQLNLSPQEQFLFAANPNAFAEVIGSRLQDRTVGDHVVRDGKSIYEVPEESKVYNTAGGLLQVNPDNTQEWLYEAEENAPNGYRWVGENLEYIPGGPADPRVMETAAASRRAPPRSRAGSVRGASSNRGVTSVAPSSVRWD
jgi:hypothetical protein